MRKPEEVQVWKRDGNHEFYFENVKFETPTRHATVKARDKHLGVIIKP